MKLALVDAALRRCSPDELDGLRAQVRAGAGLDIVGFSIHLPLAGDRRRARRRGRTAGSAVLDRRPRTPSAVGQPPRRATPTPALRDTVAGVALPACASAPALWHGDKSALHLGADVLDVRAGARRRSRRLPPRGDRRRRHARDGRRRHRPRRRPARRRAQPVPLPPRAVCACSSARTCTRRWSFVPARRAVPGGRRRVDVQRPLIDRRGRRGDLASELASTAHVGAAARHGTTVRPGHAARRRRGGAARRGPATSDPTSCAPSP